MHFSSLPDLTVLPSVPLHKHHRKHHEVSAASTLSAFLSNLLDDIFGLTWTGCCPTNDMKLMSVLHCYYSLYFPVCESCFWRIWLNPLLSHGYLTAWYAVAPETVVIQSPSLTASHNIGGVFKVILPCVFFSFFFFNLLHSRCAHKVTKAIRCHCWTGYCVRQDQSANTAFEFSFSNHTLVQATALSSLVNSSKGRHTYHSLP